MSDMKTEMKKALVELRHERDQRNAKGVEMVGMGFGALLLFFAGIFFGAGALLMGFYTTLFALVFACLTEISYSANYRIRRTVVLEPKENAKSGK